MAMCLHFRSLTEAGCLVILIRNKLRCKLVERVSFQQELQPGEQTMIAPNSRFLVMKHHEITLLSSSE